MSGPITQFIDHHYRHFNAAALKDAADGYIRHMNGGNAMLLAMAGAMSTAELGVSLAEMIRAGQGERDFLHGREPRRGHFQPCRAQSLRAHPLGTAS
jgi:hypothetical protein